MRPILRLLANAGALAAATGLLRDIALTDVSPTHRVMALLLVALIFGLVNALVKPIFELVTVPLVLVTLGLLLLVINGLMLLLTSWVAGQVGLGWRVDGFGTAVVGGIIVGVVSFVLNAFVPDRPRPRRG